MCVRARFFHYNISVIIIRRRRPLPPPPPPLSGRIVRIPVTHGRLPPRIRPVTTKSSPVGTYPARTQHDGSTRTRLTGFEQFSIRFRIVLFFPVAVFFLCEKCASFSHRKSVVEDKHAVRLH